MSGGPARDAAPRALPGASRRRILDTALELVARYGYDGMSLQLLADQAGLHKSTLFHHFPGKAELVDEVAGQVMEELLELLAPLEAADPPDLEQFVAIALELDDYFAQRPGTALFVIRLLLGPVEAFHPFDLGDTSDPVVRLFAVLGSWLDRARRAGAVRPLSVPQAIANLMALGLFYPALAESMERAGGDRPLGDPRSAVARRRRRRELGETLRRALSP